MTEQNERVVILGANSGIARALAHTLAGRGCRLLLAGRNSEELERTAADLRIRHEVDVCVEVFDATDRDSHAHFWDRCVNSLDGRVDGAVFAFGTLPSQQDCETDSAATALAIEVNFTATVLIAEQVARHMQTRESGWIAVISSVAGDRGRQSNYIYGSAKAGVTACLQGLRNRLHDSGVHVLTVKPGFVATPMTDGLLDPNSLLVASPERVARDIDRAIRKRRNVLYTPWFWRWIMVIIRLIPEPIFKRMKL